MLCAIDRTVGLSKNRRKGTGTARASPARAIN
jgi:hypothetical protein